MKLLTEAPITAGTKVFVRCDIDVPIEKGVIGETFRLDNLLETLKYIVGKGGFPIIAGHIGKPDGKYVEELSTKQLLPYFNDKLGENTFELLENLRFDPREEGNDEEYAKELATKAEIYVNESFATCHRKHASIVGIAKILPSFAGFRLQKEIQSLDKAIKDPERPLVVIIGGAKLESKLPVINKFQGLADFILLSSLLSANWSNEITHNIVLANNKGTEPKDIDETTRSKFKEILNTAKTVLWAGPLGMYENEEYVAGTRDVANKIAEITKNNGCFSVIGGGDTVTAVNRLGLLNEFSFVSTGGGAMLEYLAEGTLPGIEMLK